MSRRGRITLVGSLVLVIAVAAWLFLPPSEPVYAGKSLSGWLYQAFWTGGPTTETTTAIRSMGTNALPTLLRLLQTKDDRLRHAIVTLVRRPSRDLFRVNSASDCHRMGTWGFDALGPTGKPAVPSLVSLLKDHDEDVRSTAAYCLGVIGPGAQEVVPALTQCLSNAVGTGSGSILKERLATALGRMGPAAQQAIPILTVVTADSIWYARNAAKAALVKIRGESIIPLIDRLEDTSDPIKWYEAAMLVGDFGTNAEPAIPLLISALGNANDLIIGHAAVALGEIHRQPEVCVPALIPLLSSPSVSTRQKSLIALSEFGATATSAVPAIRRCFRDSDPWVRMRAPTILKEIDSEAAAKAGEKLGR